ncbi:MAG: hypothetical protein AAGD40_08995 [Pseudomonadota bacterium]
MGKTLSETDLLERFSRHAEVAISECKNACKDDDFRAYSLQYQPIVDTFSEMTKQGWNEDRVRIGALLVYGWMPTIPRFESFQDRGHFKISEIADRLNSRADDWSDNWCRWLNNSPTGTSKFLHFWRPNKFAIWDQRVAKALGVGYRVREPKIVELYQRWITSFRFEKISIREIEVALFLKGKT